MPIANSRCRTVFGLLMTVIALSVACGGDRAPTPAAPTSPAPPPPPAPPAPPAPSTWSISGVVRSESDAPVADARVEVVEGADTGRSVQTGADGRYRLEELREGALAIRASAEGFEPQNRSLTLSSNQTTDFLLRRSSTPPPPPTARALTGTLVEGLSHSAIAGAAVAIDGLGVFTTDGDGVFRLEAPDPERVLGVTIASPAIVTRSTHLRVPGPDTRLTAIPGSFDLAAFDQMFRGNGRLQRWASAPRLVIQTRVLQFSSVTAQDYVATDRSMSDEEVDLLRADLAWGLPLLTDAKLVFATDTRETAGSGASVRVTRTGEIVVARYAGLRQSTGFWGYGRWASDGAGTIIGGVVMLDEGFDTSGSQYRRSLRAHELGHALGYNHVTARASVMNSSATIEPNQFDLHAAKIGFLRPPGNRTPDTDPDPFTINVQSGIVIWYGDR